MNVLLSINPEFAKLIYNGEKFIEWRKNFPKKFNIDTKIFLYETKPIKRVTGFIYLDTSPSHLNFNSYDDLLENYNNSNYVKSIVRCGCVDLNYIKNYANENKLVAWMICRAIRFKDLFDGTLYGCEIYENINLYAKKAPQNWIYTDTDLDGEYNFFFGQYMKKQGGNHGKHKG